jgi:orotate phosphoribosyltransferase
MDQEKTVMENHVKRLAKTLAETGALFFDKGLVLKDGRPTPYFVNMAMFKTGRLSLLMGSFFAEMMISRELEKRVDVILGPSYKGSTIALSTSIALWQEYEKDVAFDYDRKEAKTHGEASGTKGMFVNQSFFDGCRLFIVDDVATSMGTKYDLLEKIEVEALLRGMTIHVEGIGIGIDREQTTAVYDEEGNVVLGRKGNSAIEDFVSKSGIGVYAVAGIREVVQHLYEEGVPVLVRGNRIPIDDKTKTEFDLYMDIYGI